MNIINQAEVDRLCRAYSETNSQHHIVQQRVDKIERLLDVEMSGMQKLFRRKLAVAIRGSGSIVMRARVWASIAHGTTPVTITPIASAAILVRKGVSIHISFIATEDNIVRECARISEAVDVL